MEGGSDRAVPLTLEKCQPCRGHGVRMLFVELECAKGSHLQAVAGNKTQAPSESLLAAVPAPHHPRAYERGGKGSH